MAQATFFDYYTGRITGHIACSESAFWPNVEDKDWIAGCFEEGIYYVDTKEYRPLLRPEMEGITVEGNIVSGLPIPCEVECNGESYTVDDGEFEYDTPLIGTYHFRVRAFPNRDFDGELTVAPQPECTPEPTEEATADENPAQTE